ncbi:MAG TPA: hypothetical protein VNC50_19485, partial [Planctomycetia bacterium]|nr:hypothetical protein [Planctomycetia bacterium]
LEKREWSFAATNDSGLVLVAQGGPVVFTDLRGAFASWPLGNPLRSPRILQVLPRGRTEYAALCADLGTDGELLAVGNDGKHGLQIVLKALRLRIDNLRAVASLPGGRILALSRSAAGMGVVYSECSPDQLVTKTHTRLHVDQGGEFFVAASDDEYLLAADDCFYRGPLAARKHQVDETIQSAAFWHDGHRHHALVASEHRLWQSRFETEFTALEFDPAAGLLGFTRGGDLICCRSGGGAVLRLKNDRYQQVGDLPPLGEPPLAILPSDQARGAALVGRYGRILVLDLG